MFAFVRFPVDVRVHMLSQQRTKRERLPADNALRGKGGLAAHLLMLLKLRLVQEAKTAGFALVP